MAQPRDDGEAGAGLSGVGFVLWQQAGNAAMGLKPEQAGQSGKMPRSWPGTTTSIQKAHNRVAKIFMPCRCMGMDHNSALACMTMFSHTVKHRSRHESILIY